MVTFAFAAGAWATTAQAQTVHSLTGDARYQIGNGIPIPIGFTPAPNGRIDAVSGAAVTQTTGPDPKQMTIPPGQLTALGTPVVIGAYLVGGAFQVQTAIGLSFPGPGLGGVFKAGGRTGAATVTFCAGQVVTATGNPACAGPGATGNLINGLMRYTKTAAQFGGVMQANFGGSANIAMRIAGTPPGTVTAIFAPATPPLTGAWGGPFGFKASISGAAPPPPSGIGGFYANANGTFIGPPLWQHPTAYGLPNPWTSFGGPWTTGRLTVSVTANLGPSPEVFTFTGSDNRINGVGTISLVSGSIGTRTVSGPNAHRGWLNLTVGPRTGSIPAISERGLAAVFGLLALAGGCVLRRRGHKRHGERP